MIKEGNRLDAFFLAILIIVFVGLPFAIKFYDRSQWSEAIPEGSKTFKLTGHTEKGWILGDVHAHDIFSLWKDHRMEKPVIEVSKGDRVAFIIKSSDVVHGFSLKDFGVFVTEGIQPGRVKLISFVANRSGVFTFSCNAICGENHQNMQGTLVVRA